MKKIIHILVIFTAVLLSLCFFQQPSDLKTSSTPDIKVRLALAQSFQYTQLDSAWNILQSVANTISKSPVQDATTSIQAALAMVTFGRIADSLYYSDIAIQSFKTGIQLFEYFPEENKKNIASTTQGLGICLLNNYQLNESLQVLNKALSLSIDAFGEFSVDVGDCYDHIGNVYYSKGDYYEAIMYYQKQYNVLWKVYNGESKWLSYPICQMAGAYSEIANYKKAIQLFEEGRRLGNKMGGFQHYYWDALSIFYLKDGNYEKALEEQMKTIQIKTEFYNTEFNSEIGIANRTLGDIYFAKNDFVRADSFYHKSLYILQQLGVESKETLAQTWLSLALLEKAKKEFDKGISDCENALQYTVLSPGALKNKNQEPSFDQTSYPQLLADILECKGDLLLSKFEKNDRLNYSDLEQSLNAYEKSIECITHIYREMEEENSKAYFIGQVYPIYEKSLKTALYLYKQAGKRKWAEKAFFFIEKSKSALLLEAVRQSRAEHFAGVPEDLQVKVRKLRIRKLRLESDIQTNLDFGESENSEIIKALRDSVFASETAYKDIIASIAEQFPDYYRLKYDTVVSSVSDLQSQLSDKQIILEYFQGNQYIYVFAITTNGCEFREIEADSVLKGQIARVNDFVYHERQEEKQDKKRYIADAFSLYQKLIGPFEHMLSEKQDIIVIPDGDLSALPLQVLLTEMPEQPEPSYRILPYLIKKYDISYSYSATLLMQPFVDRHPRSYFGGWAPEYNSDNSNASNQSTLSPLLSNKEEVEKSAIVFGGDTYLGKVATESVFKRNAGNYKMLLLSMHGFANDSVPRLSRLVFSEKPEGGEDGSLYSYEIYGLSLSASLAVLSACETGKGHLMQGEGIQSLARAFRYAGCPSIVASYWKANESASTDLIERFFINIGNTIPATTALESAKRYIIDHGDDERLAHPHFWATFNYIGGQLNTPGIPWGLLLLTFAITGIVSFIIWQRLRKKH